MKMFITHNWRVPVLVLLEIFISLPFLISHPQMVREDWQSIARLHEYGIWHTDIPAVGIQRPPTQLIYAGIYALANLNLQVAYGVMILICAFIATLIYALCARFFDRRWSLLVAGLWIVMPTHLTLDHWFSASNIDVSALCALGSLLVLERWSNSWRASGMAGIIAAIGVTAYQACVPFIFVGLIGLYALARVQARRLHYGKTVLFIAIYISSVIYAVFASLHYHAQRWSSPWRGWYQNVGIVHEWFTLCLVIALVVSLLSMYLMIRMAITKKPTSAHLMVLSGFIIFIVGIIPFLEDGYDVMFVGVGDRANYLASIGVCLVVVGLARQLSLRLATSSLILISIALVPIHVSRSIGWAHVSKTIVKTGDYLLASRPSAIYIQNKSGQIPGENLGLDAQAELEAYLESGWHYPAVVPQRVPLSETKGVDAPALVRSHQAR